MPCHLTQSTTGRLPLHAGSMFSSLPSFRYNELKISILSKLSGLRHFDTVTGNRLKSPGNLVTCKCCKNIAKFSVYSSEGLRFDTLHSHIKIHNPFYLLIFDGDRDESHTLTRVRQALNHRPTPSASALIRN